MFGVSHRVPLNAPASAHRPTPLRPVFRADWVNAVFIHYRIDPAVLQPHVPFELDLYKGDAYVTLVAFTQQNLRPTVGGRLSAALSRPVGCHAFLNVRTYVRHQGESGIYFIAEWIPNRLSALLGPRLYGLPFRLGRLCYRHDAARGRVTGSVHAYGVPRDAGALRFEARAASANFDRARGLDEFLVERYAAYTCAGAGENRVLRRFRIAHAPWPQVRAKVRLAEATLRRLAGSWWPHAEFAGAHYSPGVFDVEIGPPQRLDPRPARSCLWTVLPPLALPPAWLALHPHLPAWAFMWAVACSLFFACKWVTWRSAVTGGACPSAGRSLAYLLAYPGMDARAFLDSRRRPLVPAPRAWVSALAKALAGAALVWLATPALPPWAPLVRAWAGMIGLVLLLHFGTFHLLALFWRRAGIDARPIMDRPSRSRSLAEFWGERWNRGFHQLATDLVFRPLTRRFGTRVALTATFLASGLVHDLIISLPAGGGFGLPTLYFLIQAAGVAMQRSAAGRRLGLGRGAAGWLMTAMCTLAPVPLLFHGPFVHRVVLPFLDAIGATG
jgi:alginate O-acetyltransferase complex protein AlgI